MVSVLKKAIRALGIAESFYERSEKSLLSGVVMRSDFIVDGFSFSFSTLRGNDATDAVIKLFKNMNREDVNIIMLGGVVISLYNIISIKKVFEETKVPVIAVTYKESRGLEEHIIRNFPDRYEEKLEQYRKLGSREKIILKTGKEVFIRKEGLTLEECKIVLDKFTLSGRIPEPIKVARLLSRSILRFLESSEKIYNKGD